MHDLHQLEDNLSQLRAAISHAIDAKFDTPALILLFSAIDTAAWLHARDDFSTSSDFIHWVEQYLLPSRHLDCSALDLYAARCGLLHTFTAYSKLSAQGHARLIGWARGATNVSDLRAALAASCPKDTYVAVHVGELFEAWWAGVQQFLEELRHDPNRAARAVAKGHRFFVSMEPSLVAAAARLAPVPRGT